MKLKKCEICDADISDEKCVFAVCKRVVDDQELYFCCENHANKFEY